MLDTLSKHGFIKNLVLNSKNVERSINVATIISVSVFILLAILSIIGITQGIGTPIDFFVLALLSGTGIYGMYKYMVARKIHKMDSIFPDFVRDLAESRRAGMTFTKAILFASKGSYGLLTPEIRKISQQVSWGTNVSDALIDFSKRVSTKSIRRTISLIIEASKSGGNVADVLDLAAKDAREIKMLESERKANMASYVIVVYVGMFVFLAIIAILTSTFIPNMIGSGAQGLQGVMGGGTVKQEDVSMVFYLATLVQGLGSGLVAGVFEDGNLSSSVKHVFVMVLISWLAFKILLGM
ncbi:MAG: type II secretion system F family protein [Candidatus Thermoplasmatota archaeon]|nr:type II secretion system F family protein [Candidatus Thermoplasmatota archaeon]